MDLDTDRLLNGRPIGYHVVISDEMIIFYRLRLLPPMTDNYEFPNHF